MHPAPSLPIPPPFDSYAQSLPAPTSAPSLDIALLASPFGPALLKLSRLPRDTRLEGGLGKLTRLIHASQLQFFFAFIRAHRSTPTDAVPSVNSIAELYA